MKEEMQQEEPKMIECYFIPTNNTSSATICGNCGKEKFLHTIGLGIKVSKSEQMKQTAVEWLEQQLFNKRGKFTKGDIEQSKEMEKEQKKCYHPLSERKYTSDTHFECTICGGNNY
jgi:hypothetical protein